MVVAENASSANRVSLSEVLFGKNFDLESPVRILAVLAETKMLAKTPGQVKGRLLCQLLVWGFRLIAVHTSSVYFE